MQKQLSIIIPVYNVEKYIRSCVESVFRQGLSDEDYEIIIVNDGTKDRSMEQITDIVERHANIMVINQENEGLSVARNNGLAKAGGEFILFLDSDDLLMEGSLPLILQTAADTQADMLINNFLELTSEEIAASHGVYTQECHLPVMEGMRTGKELLFARQNYVRFAVWQTLYRHDFLQRYNIQFIPGIYYEDVAFTYECYLRAERCLMSNILLNIYRRRNHSITSTYTLKHAKDHATAFGKSWSLRKTTQLTAKEYQNYQDRMYSSFYSIAKEAFKHFQDKHDRLRAMEYISQSAPDLCFTNGMDQRLATILYRISPRLLMLIWIQRWNWVKRFHNT